MIAEMENKFASMSEVLVCDLIDRDKFIFGLNIKNKFISALLQVQVLRHSNSQSGGSRLESVSRAWAVKSRQSEERMNIRVRAVSYLSLMLNYNPIVPLLSDSLPHSKGLHLEYEQLAESN